MSLPININQLLSGRVVEWERIDFKKGWNPEDVVHSICAFANDVNNWGGGYIVVGIEEDNGTPVLPPIGLDIKTIDSIQKEILNITHKIEPLPVVIPQPVEYMEKMILIIWVPGGETRPYKAPTHLGSKGTQKAYYIRKGSVTKKTSQQEEQWLLSLASKIPFDDRICHAASLDDLSLLYIRDFLRKVDSDITDEDIRNMPFEQLCWQMQIIGGTPEFIRPKNVGLLFFSENPEKYIPYARIEIVRFYDDVGDHFDEKILHGPIHLQLQEALDYLRSQVIVEKVVKVDDKAEANRAYNYPYTALEEILSNAVYHKSYDDRNPIEVRIEPNSIMVYSLAGPMPPITNDDLKKEKIVTRNYRNRRIGDFLKELELTEGRSTGFPKIYRAMRGNGSADPIFETDENNQYFLAKIPIHPAFVGDNVVKDVVKDVIKELSERQKVILGLMRENDRISAIELSQKIGVTQRTIQREIAKLTEKGCVSRIAGRKIGYWKVIE
jgi:ATP-dependent DNA helicase RecG